MIGAKYGTEDAVQPHFCKLSVGDAVMQNTYGRGIKVTDTRSAKVGLEVGERSNCDEGKGVTHAGAIGKESPKDLGLNLRKTWEVCASQIRIA